MFKLQRKYLFWLCLPGGLGLIVLLASLTMQARLEPTPVVQPTSQPVRTISDWHPLYVGIEHCSAFTNKPRLMRIQAIRVDLHEPTIKLLVTPSNGDRPKDCDARQPSAFMREFKCQVVINGSAFTPPLAHPGDPVDVRGVSLSNGNLYSPPNKFDALLFDRQNRGWLDQAPIDTANAYQGLSGFYALLVDGNNVGTSRKVHPRSAAGISQDGRYLILMALDGRRVGYSEGATTAETAEWMAGLGAYHALNLDGGGSTAMVIEGIDGQPLVINRPSGQFERHVANHLAVFARSFDEPTATLRALQSRAEEVTKN